MACFATTAVFSSKVSLSQGKQSDHITHSQKKTNAMPSKIGGGISRNGYAHKKSGANFWEIAIPTNSKSNLFRKFLVSFCLTVQSNTTEHSTFHPSKGLR